MGTQDNKQNPEGISFEDFIAGKNFAKESVAFVLWQQAMIQYRHLHDAVWRAVTFNLTINGIIIAGIAAIVSKPPEGKEYPGLLGCIVVAALAFGGIIFCARGRSIFDSHRRHYLKQAAIKTLLEVKLGFYNCQAFHTNGEDSSKHFAFQWDLGCEGLIDDREAWQAKHFSPVGSASNNLRELFCWFWLAYGWLLVFAFLGGFCRGFQLLGCAN